jgi:thiol-disulfide isomerase/thioredoxin
MRMRRTARRTVFLLVLASRLAWAASVGVGDRLPAFALTSWDGAPLASADLAGKVVVVDFWASWCVSCREALPAIDGVARRAVERGAIVLAVNVDRDRAAAEAWLAERLPTRHVTLARDGGGELLARLGAGGMPAVYVVDHTGVVRFTESGYGPDRVRAIEDALDAALAARPRDERPS